MHHPGKAEIPNQQLVRFCRVKASSGNMLFFAMCLLMISDQKSL